jgi:hypothetical protein
MCLYIQFVTFLIWFIHGFVEYVLNAYTNLKILFLMSTWYSVSSPYNFICSVIFGHVIFTSLPLLPLFSFWI